MAIKSPIWSRSARARRPTRRIPAIHHGDPVRQFHHLVELGRHEDDGGPGITLGDDLAMDEFDAADVETAGRLVEQEDGELSAELARDDGLLLVPARQRARGGAGRWRPDVVVLDRPLGPRPDGFVVTEVPAAYGGSSYWVRTRLSSIGKLNTRPKRWRSPGTNDMPAAWSARGPWPVTS